MHYRFQILPALTLLFSASTLCQLKETIPLSLSSPETRIPSLLPYRAPQHPRVGLVLSGGGARGISQIGVLKALEKHNVPIDLIVGTSMGAVIGGLYAAGYSTDQLQTLVESTNWEETLSFTDESKRADLFVDQKAARESGFLVIRFDGLQPVIPSSISSGQRLTNLLNRLILQGLYRPSSSFDDLKIPFRAVVTDLVSGRRIVLSEGDLTEALRASTTVPLVFSPVKRDSMLLMDGGLVSNIPVDVAQKEGVDLIVVVNTTSGFRSPDQLAAPWETADQIISIMQQLSNETQLRGANVVITPPIDNHLSSDFSGLDSLIKAGERAAEEKIAEIRSKLLPLADAGGYSAPEIVAEGVKFRGDPIPESLKTALSSEHWIGVPKAVIESKLSEIYSLGDYADVHAEVQRTNGNSSVTIVAKYNPILQDLKFIGARLFSDSVLKESFQPMLGKVINHREGRRLLESLLQRYRDKGYSLARIDSVYYDEGTGIATIWIDEGRVEKVRIEGNEHTRPYVITREFPLNAGDYFTLEKANRGVAHILSTNLFQSVLLNVRYEEEKPVLFIKVKEKSPELVRLGLRADNERNTQVSVDLRNENLYGTGTEVGIDFAGGSRNREFRLEYRTNRIFDSYFSFDLEAYHRFRDIFVYEDGSTSRISRWARDGIGEYRQIKFGGSLTLGTQVARLGKVTGELKVERHEIKPLSGTGYTPTRFRLVGLRLGSTIDTEDRYPFPTDGMFLKTYYESALSELGSEVSYSKVFFTYEYFSTPFKAHTFHPKFTFGWADQTLPLTEQFSLGGQESFFGLRDDDRRGRQIFLINFEYRWALPFKIIFDSYLSLRYDLGSVWRIPEDIRLRDFHHGFGVELGLDTPIGPAQFAVGRSFLFRRDLPDNPLSFGPYQVYFSIGYRL